MSRIEERLGAMGVTLPNLLTPLANYVPAKRVGNLVFTAGQVSAVEGRAYKGKLGAGHLALRMGALPPGPVSSTVWRLSRV